jgi:hypothetical protein
MATIVLRIWRKSSSNLEQFQSSCVLYRWKSGPLGPHSRALFVREWAEVRVKVIKSLGF